MDFDIEMEDAATGPYPVVDVDNSVMPLGDEMLPIDNEVDKEPGEIDEPSADGAGASADQDPDTTLVPNKVYLRGLDTLTPGDIKAYLAEHLGSSSSSTNGGGGAGLTAFQRIEWIDDYSANLLFSDTAAAAAAVSALAAMPLSVDDAAQLPVRELLPAKPFVKNDADASSLAAPDSTTAAAAGLQVRFAVVSDRKQAGAAARSRFYLLHPEYDPEERRRNPNHRRGDGRGDSYRPGGGSSGRQQRRYRDDRRDDRDDRDKDIRNNTFDASLYDDDAPALARRPQRRRRSRSRSWSRSRSPSQSRAPWRESNRGKELFAEGSGSSSGGGVSKELFPDKLGNKDRSMVDGLASSSSGRDWDRDHIDRQDRDRTRNHNRNNRRKGNSRLDPDYGRLRSSRSASPSKDGFFYDEQGGGGRLNGSGGGSSGGNDNDDDYDGRLADARAEAAAEEAARNRNKARAIKDRLSNSKPKELFSIDAMTVQLNDKSSFNIRGLAEDVVATGSGDGGLNLNIKNSALARELFPSRFQSSGGGGTVNDESMGEGGRNGRNGGNGSKGTNSSQGGGRSLESRITRPRQRAKDLFH